MNLYQKLITTITTVLLTANPVQAFEVISAEDLNNSGNGTHASINLTATAETNFLNKLTDDVSTESFENYAWATPSDLELVFPNSGSAILRGSGKVYSIEHVEGVTNRDVINHEFNTGRHAVSGVNYWQTSAEVETSSTFMIDFTEYIAAFGFYAYDLGDFGGDLDINLYRDGELVGVVKNSEHNLYQIAASGENNGSAVYVGIVGEKQEDGSYETFDQVEFVIVNNQGSFRDDFGFDDMTIATPEQIKSILTD